ncbi:DUF1217 domain-containing protein [Pseudooceanicola sp. C21-150M6]|uniref:DUF1217 domain-containing protein n=1 Tax=Pseudooceanicola sp. C21-150M6 TaxID=3434355 RepID=UPI003D7F90A3
MSFLPVSVGTGIQAWVVLNKTMEDQSKTFNKSPQIQRDTEYFEERINGIQTAEELVSDRRLLRVALGAFGLQDDINNRAFIQKILEGGSIEDDALANRLTDDRYRALSAAFGFGDFDIPRTKISDFGPKITEKFRRQQFEVAVGNSDQNLRLALNAERGLADMAESNVSENVRWLRIMGNPPLREVMEVALGLPSSFSQLDIEQQLDVFRERAEREMGSRDVLQFSDSDVREKLIQKFLIRAQLEEFQVASGGQISISLLQSAADFAYSLKNT